MNDYVTRAEFNDHRREASERHDRVEAAMRRLEEDWRDTQDLLPTKREVEQVDEHLHRQDAVLWGIVFAIVGAAVTVALTLVFIH